MSSRHNADAAYDEHRRVQRATRLAESSHAADDGRESSAAHYSNMLPIASMSGRGNGPVRIAALQRIQQTYGNRAVQRFLQRSASHSLLAVQRCGGEVHAGCPCASGAGDKEAADVQRFAVQRRDPQQEGTLGSAVSGAIAGALGSVAGSAGALLGAVAGALSGSCALTTYSGSNMVGEAVVADVEFVDSLDKINSHAAANNVNLHITSSFRTSSKVKGAIVKPATKSNHMAGHAIDMNVLYGPSKDKWCNSKCLGGKLPAEVKGFIDAIRGDSGLRWGGDFGDKDPVHIDDGLNGDMSAWDARWKATQEARKAGCG